MKIVKSEIDNELGICCLYLDSGKVIEIDVLRNPRGVTVNAKDRNKPGLRVRHSQLTANSVDVYFDGYVGQ